ncbi:MAG TPA: ABC transporter permease, partial [Chitinophagaceae bacterium]|nr:ABC transporter permease [Chitinophagaceae bacterium]
MLKFFSDTWKSRYLITTWAKYNIESTYLEAKLGVLWIILQPIIEALIYTAVFGFILDRKPRGDAPFVLFFLSGMILWNFFSNAMVRSATLMNSKINTISQIKFPNQTLVFVFILEKFVDFLVAFVVLLSFNAF